MEDQGRVYQALTRGPVESSKNKPGEGVTDTARGDTTKECRRAGRKMFTESWIDNAKKKTTRKAL